MVAAERDGTRQGENATYNAGAGGDGVADIRQNGSFKSGVRAKSGRAANCQNTFPAVAPLARTTEELLAVVSVVLILKT